MDRSGRFRPAAASVVRWGMPCLLPTPESGEYPVVCRVDRDRVEDGDVWEAGYLRMVPAAVYLAEYCYAALRFVAPASGKYHLRLHARTGALAFGGSECRLLGPDNRILASHFLPKHFGSRWSHESTERLAAGEAITFSVSPSPNGDAASDEVLLKWTLEELPTNWWPVAGVGAALLAGTWFWRRRQKVPGTGALSPKIRR